MRDDKQILHADENNIIVSICKQLFYMMNIMRVYIMKKGVSCILMKNMYYMVDAILLLPCLFYSDMQYCEKTDNTWL